MKFRNIKDRVAAVLKEKGLSVNKASAVLGIPQRTLNRQVNEGGNTTMELVYSILDSFPDISPQWLVAGEGTMYREQSDLSMEYAVPFYDELPVSAGLRDAFDPGREVPGSYISLPSSKADFFFPVSGTSMEPEINSGDIIGVKRLKPDEGFVHGGIYMVVTNDSRMIKRCYYDDHNQELIWCVSPNYPSFPVNKNDICAMFRVVNRIESLD